MNTAELRRLEAEATPGKWEVSEDNILINEDDEIGELILWSDKDIALIVAMRNALPELLKALEEAQKRNAVMENALTNISMMHDGNPPLVLADIPEVDYARRVITTMRLEARHALLPHGGKDVG